MDNLIICTSQDSYFEKFFQSTFKNIKKNGILKNNPNYNFRSDALYIIEISENYLEYFKQIFHNYENNNIIFLGKKINKKVNSFMKDYGFAYYINNNEISISFFKQFNSMFNNKKFSKKILIIDDNYKRINLLKSIFYFFNIEIIPLKSQDDLFMELNDNVILNIVNIGTGNFDIIKFIKQAQGVNYFIKYPLLTFKDPYEMVELNELKCGLNRYSKAILSKDELYNFLVSMFFKNNFYSEIGSLNSIVNFKMNRNFASSRFEELYHSMGSDVFSVNLADFKDNYDVLIDNLDSINLKVLKYTLLKWLLLDFDKNQATCGLGV